MAEKILEVKNLSVVFNHNKIIDNLSFTVNNGDFYIILGPSGAGKTTLFRAILGLVPYEGEVNWLNNNLKIGYLPERLSRTEFGDLPISVKDFFELKEKKIDKILETLGLVGLDQKILNRNPSELSSGQFQRMLIAWALVDDPGVLLFDEPNTGIDISKTETIYSLLEKMRREKGITIFVITHDLNIVYGYATNILCLNGKGICSGMPREVLTPDILENLYGGKVKFYTHHH